MSDNQHFCRICRGEGTEDQPLLHPCKCRGSIKYIHQDCLMEWLKHSNKSTKQCDICNTPYRFRTIYDPNMPDIIPPEYIWQKIQASVTKSIIKFTSIGLYFICLIIQVPLFWKFIGRLYTWAIDGKLPYNNSNFLEALLFGEYNIYQYEFVNDPTKFKLFKIRKFFDYTYFSGLRYICVFLIIHLALFVEHEWVVRDEGYTKLLLRKIGKEPKSRLVDMFQNALHGLRNDAQNGNHDADDVVNRIEMIANAINDLQEPNNDRHRELDLMANLRENAARLNDQQQQHQQAHPQENGIERNEVRENEDMIREANNLHRQALDHLHQSSSDEDADSDAEADADQIRPPRGGDINPQPGDEPDRRENQPVFDGPVFDGRDENPDIDPDAQAQFDRLLDQAGRGGDGNIIDAGQFQNQPQGELEGAQGIAEADIDNENGNFFELLGLNLNITTPIFLMIMCNVILTVYLFITYLIPQVIGTLITGTTGLGINMLVRLATASPIMEKVPVNKWKESLFTPDGYFVKTENQFLDFLLFTLNDIIFLPAKNIFSHVFLSSAEHLKDHQLTLIERLIPLSLGYTLLGVLIWQFMRMLLKGGKPVKGSARKLYKILFEFTSTIKVFVIFAIEIFFFPVYCGWLLDFCAAPILLDSFKVNDTTNVSTGKVRYLLLFTSSSDLFTVNYIRIALYWACGTLYMLFFALFVGMVRGKILRPGVLFFIRSPDDPNARLIHDALVKPFMLQLSRIYLSGKVYTAFILVGIGGVTWGLRYCLHKDQVILPVNIYGYSTLCFCGITIASLIHHKQLISKYCEFYWRKGFEISCHKLRLSHFILGKPIPQERGYVLYRNMWEQFKGIEYPDYTKPVTYREAQKLFDEVPSVNCYFIPDGNYIRVPDNDTVSRKFVKKLFVPVTKDDRLLSTNDGAGFLGDELDDNESSDEEFNNENNHTVVYRPPNLKFRCFELILMLWVFSVILLVSIIFVGLLIGRPFVQLLIVLEKLPFSMTSTNSSVVGENLRKSIIQYDWKLADLWSISVGVYLELILLKYYDRKREDGSNEVGGHAHNGRREPQGDERGLRNIANLQGLVFGNLTLSQYLSMAVLLLLDTILWFWWIFIVHKGGIDLPMQIHEFGLESVMRVEGHEDSLLTVFIINKLSIGLHIFFSYWTFIPFLKSTWHHTTTHYQNQEPQNDANEVQQGVERNPEQNSLVVRRFYDDLCLKMLAKRLFSIVFIGIICEVVDKRLGERQYWATGPPGIELGPKAYLICGMISLVFVAIDMVNRGKSLLDEYVVQVKNERYIRGRALENMDE